MEEKIHPSDKGIQTSVIGIVAGFFLAVIKGVAGVLGHSQALVADAVESAADVFTSVIVIIGLKVSAKEPDENHPYGHGKAEPVAGIVISFFMIGAAIYICIESIRHIMTPHELPRPYTLVVLLVVVFIKELLYRYVIKIGHETESSAVKADAWHHRSDAITSAAAFIGITIALIGGEGYESADDWAALFAAAIILYNAWTIFTPAFAEILDTAPPPELNEQTKQIAAQIEGVEGLDKCFVRKMGFEYYIDLHVLVNGEKSVREGHDIAHKVKDVLKQENPRIRDVLVHIEPAD
ncbi:cation diffusion facilitator family transporter [Cytophagaceae bacterium ABcell3]|nr:cation diffusion facilitator family transporter [Cytophagaceae bacterium ABcell3]